MRSVPMQRETFKSTQLADKLRILFTFGSAQFIYKRMFVSLTFLTEAGDELILLE